MLETGRSGGRECHHGGKSVTPRNYEREIADFLNHDDDNLLLFLMITEMRKATKLRSIAITINIMMKVCKQVTQKTILGH